MKQQGGHAPTVSIIGLGYVGLCTGVCFARKGIRVYGVEVDPEKREKISAGIAPISEPGLDKALASVVRAGCFSCTSDYYEAIRESEITFVTVGTPSTPSGSIDLRYIEAAAREIGRVLASKKRYHLVVIKSTVTPGTSEGIVKQILERESQKRCSQDFGLCVNPEFLREGSAIEDTMKPDAVVIGSSNKKATHTLIRLYEYFYGKRPKLIETSTTSGEFVKYSINTFRAVQLSFLNTLANMCEKTPSADVVEVVKGLSAVTKIDPRYLRAGLGYGGSCLPKDVRALTARAKELEVNSAVLEGAARVNETQPSKVLEMAGKLVGAVQGKKIALLGLAFKAGTDDVRESVAIRVANILADSGSNVSAFDPEAMQNARASLRPQVQLEEGIEQCLRGAECCVIATEWEQFRQLSPRKFLQLMHYPAIIDSKRIFEPSRFEAAGVKLSSLGRGAPMAEKERESILVAGRAVAASVVS